MMSTLFVILMYSSGIPVLYFTGFVFFFVTYWINKFLLINYYKKSTTLTRTIPIYALTFIKYALFTHSFISLLMLTNPIAFKTKHRYDEDGELMGVNSLIDAEKLFIGLIKWWRSHDEDEEHSKRKHTHENLSNAELIESSPMIKFLYDRL